MTHDFPKRLRESPCGQNEVEWLDAFEFLRTRLSDAMSTVVQLGKYWIDDFPGHAGASGCACVRGRNAVPGVESDSWEGILCWSGNRGSPAKADACVFPFLRGSVILPNGRLADLGPKAETDRYLHFRFSNGEFEPSGWHHEDGPGEWVGVKAPGDVYRQNLTVTPATEVVECGQPIWIDLKIAELTLVRDKHEIRSVPQTSLVFCNRDREHTNLSPWTARPPGPRSQHVQPLAQCSFPANTIRFRLDAFNIRGGWIPGTYHLALRVQNFHQPGDWTWSCEISAPFKIAIA